MALPDIASIYCIGSNVLLFTICMEIPHLSKGGLPKGNGFGQNPLMHWHSDNWRMPPSKN